MSSVKLLLVTFVALIAYTSASACPSGWKYFPSTRSCYKLISDNLPWTVAEFKCLFQGAHHVSVGSAEENQFVHEIAQHGEIWLGGAYFGKNPVYVNSDSTPFSYEHWQGGARPAMNRARRCIKMDKKGEWFQSCCKKKTFAICKKAGNPVDVEDEPVVQAKQADENQSPWEFNEITQKWVARSARVFRHRRYV